MKRVLFTMLLMICFGFIYGQTTYYWVGGVTAISTAGTTTGANWNTALNGSGSSRPSSTGVTDILIFDGSNLGGATPVTGPATINFNGSISCAQIKIVNGADLSWVRLTTGTSTVTINGGAGDDFLVDAGAKLSFTSATGSIRVAMLKATNGICNGTLIMNTTLQARFDNNNPVVVSPDVPATFVFTATSIFRTNITSSSSSYAFGSSTSQSTDQWVTFEDGSNLYYDGGYSPNGSSSSFQAIFFKPGSFWHQRANFGVGVSNGGGSFFNKKSFGNVLIENNSIITSDGPIYRINNFTINNGCSFTTHTSGQTAIMGNVTVDGILTADPASTNEIVFAGNSSQTVSGSGTITVPALIAGDNATVVLNKSMALSADATVYGKINFTDKQLTGVVNFDVKGIATPEVGSGNTVSGTYVITGHSGISTTARGQKITGPGIPANTTVVTVSTADDQIWISNPATSTASAVALTITSGVATLETANTNGFNPASGSVVASGTMTFQDDIDYIIDGATAWPFGVTTGSSGNNVNTGSVTVNADVTVNKGVTIKNNLLMNGKMTLRPADVLHILAGGDITGTFGSAKYIATDYVPATGVQSIVQFDGISTAKTIPVGTVNYYLPATITPASTSDFTVAVFQGITTNGILNGTAFTAIQRLRVVNAVWNITRLSGSGNADLQLNWDDALEGTTFNTLPDSDIGLIRNIGSGPTGWGPPIVPGNNTTNIVMGNISVFGSFSAGAVPQVNAFIYNPLPDKTYGDADFNGGATSLNTTNPIIYTSNNPLVATIVAGNIHIVGAGTADITASQIGDGVFPDTIATKTLLVNKAALTITADNKSRFEGLANPPLTITYTGFVLGETNTVLLTQPAISTTATIASAPGAYPITVSGATAANYTIAHINGVLTVVPKQNQTITFNTPATKTYGNADFSTGATSTNNSIPITYTSSNPAVATITGNTIHITGAGTSTITAMQAGNDGYFPAPNVARTLTVNKANLTIRATDTTKVTGEVNPVFRMVVTGFVLGETVANLTTLPVVTTTAMTTSSPGYFDLVPGGATSSNYNITYVNGRLTILPLSGTENQYLLAYRNSSGNIAVRIYSPQPYLADIIVYDINGRPLATRNVLLVGGGFASAELRTQTFPSGTYIVAVRGNGVKLQTTISFLK